MRVAIRPLACAAGLLLASSALAQPTWSLLPESPNHSYRSEDISFVDPDVGWAVNGDGEVHKTTDSGASWTAQADLPGYLRSAAFVSRDVGWIGVLNSRDVELYETRDGGATFQDITARIQPALPREGGVCSLFAVSDQVIYGAGAYYGPAHLIKSTDGGQSWTSSSLAPHLDTVIDVHFFDEDRGLAVGGIGAFSGDDIRPRVIGTEDGGATWTVRHTANITRGWGWKLSFPTPEVGYMSVEKYNNQSNAYLFKTTDGGATWTTLLIPHWGTFQGSMQSVGFLTPEVGWISGRGTIGVTTDGGSTWAQITDGSQLDGNVNRFQFLDGGLGFASGHKIHRIDARVTASELDADGAWGLRVPRPNPAAASSRVAYRVGETGPVRIEVLDLLGRRVELLVEEAVPAGRHAATWEVGADVPPGLYLVRMHADGRAWTQRLVVGR